MASAAAAAATAATAAFIVKPVTVGYDNGYGAETYRKMNFAAASDLYKPMRIYDSLSEKTQARLSKAPVEIQRLMLNLVDDIRKESVSLDYLDDDDYEVPDSPKSAGGGGGTGDDDDNDGDKTAADETGADKEPDDEDDAVPKGGDKTQDAPTRVITADDAKLAEKIQNDLAKGKIKLKDLSESDLELYKYLYPTQFRAYADKEELDEALATIKDLEEKLTSAATAAPGATPARPAKPARPEKPKVRKAAIDEEISSDSDGLATDTERSAAAASASASASSDADTEIAGEPSGIPEVEEANKTFLSSPDGKKWTNAMNKERALHPDLPVDVRQRAVIDKGILAPPKVQVSLAKKASRAAHAAPAAPAKSRKK